MMTGITSIFSSMMLAQVHGGEHAAAHIQQAVEAVGLGWAGWILWLPLISMVMCGACAAMKVKSKLPAWITVTCLGVSFLAVLKLFLGYEHAMTIHLFDWFDLHWGSAGEDRSFIANFSLYVDKLTLLWMLFVTGLGTLIALYASEYMDHDVGKGYARFFAGISVFLFAMSALVMGDNLLMLYLGWEGVGFASYWLIGYFYQKPSAVAAAKKAFIVNRIGDLGLALGLYLTWHYFGTVEYAALFDLAEVQNGLSDPTVTSGGWMVKAIPFLFMLGAFGKSAQLPLYVWLPDAMEGPTPVSALIHAATMVTAGVYLIARLYPLMLLNEFALPTVAWVGGITALFAATIGMAQYDIKRIMAYSTVSQLGYMFMGLGVMTSVGGCYHVFTHAFFKAILFLTCGAIMHGFAGQLDLRKISGLRHMKGWRITAYTMGYACLCLAGFPFISSGFFSKDMILAQAFITPGYGLRIVGMIGVFTALLTAYYTFRVFFRVCMGKEHCEPGEEYHGEKGGHFHPHAPGFAINLVLSLICIGAVGSIFLKGWVTGMVGGSSAAYASLHAEGHGFWENPHTWMPWVASITTIVGIVIAWYFHLANRKAADSLRATLLGNPLTRWLPTAMENKWYLDEFYDATIVKPLWWVFGHGFALFDKYLVDGLAVDGTGKAPRKVAKIFQPLTNGVLQSYALSMAGGVGLVALLVVLMPKLVALMPNLMQWLGMSGGGTG